MSDAHSPPRGVEILEPAESRCVRIERRTATTPDQPPAVTVYVCYPRVQRVGAVVAVIVCALVLAAMPVVSLRIVPQWKAQRWFPPALTLIVLIPVGALAGVQFDRTHRRYIFRADLRGLDITSQGPFGRRSQTYPRELIDDVRLRGHEGRSGGSAGELAIAPARGWKPASGYLTGLGTIQLTRVADALREGLAMPPRS